MTLDFSLSEEQKQIQADAAEFADTVLTQVAGAMRPYHDPESRFNAIKPFYEQMADAGFITALIPKEYGGTAFTSLEFCLSAEELARVDINVPSAILSTGLGLDAIINFGSDEQKTEFLPQFTDGTPRLAGIAFSEVGGSANFDSNVVGTGVRTTARLEGDEWVINGHKQYTTNGTGWDGAHPDLFTVLCTTDPLSPISEAAAMIVVPGSTPGIEVVGMIDTLGHVATPSPMVNFTDVRVPAGNILGSPGDGVKIAQSSFTWTSAPIAIACVGRMRAAFDVAYEFAKTQHRGGPTPIIEYQNAGYMLADLKMKIEAGRYLALKAADHYDKTGGADREIANIAKVYNSELCVQAVYDAMRLVGVESYGGTDNALSEIMADALCFPIYDGGNMGVRRRQLHELMKQEGYDPLALRDGKASVYSTEKDAVQLV
nr:acyl-CoA dehydrogenase, N-terminal domain protein [Rhodococcus sp. JVH1]